MVEPGTERWLLLIHQIPPKPNYLRVKTWRRLQRLGAVAIKNSVYALPRNDQAREDLQWVLREIVEAGGDGSVCEARFVDGLSNEQVEALFHAARDADYAPIAEEARALSETVRASRALSTEQRAEMSGQLPRLRRRLAEVIAIDFFGAPGREAVERQIFALETQLRVDEGMGSRFAQSAGRPADLRNRTWVTRRGIHVDRMASAWLVRRFIDAKARFKFVSPKGYTPKRGELRFDMFEAEFTHEGDRCTFEVLVERCGLADPALRPIAEIVHDIDLKDGKFGRPEATGIERLIAGIAMANKHDEERLARGLALFGDLYEYFRRKPGERPPAPTPQKRRRGSTDDR
jgi:hypothetical protein